MQRPFRTFLGVDLGGGKGKTTAMVRLRLTSQGDKPLVVEDCGSGKPYFDDRLLTLVEQHKDDAVLAVDAPLTLPVCVRCTLPSCPSLTHCSVDTVRWFRDRTTHEASSGKPRYTPYTQRATEVILHEVHQILPRETLGQGMGPLTARALYLRQALRKSYVLNQNLIEVYPKATLTQLFPDPAPPQPASAIRYRDAQGRPVSIEGKPLHPGSTVARTYKRGHGPDVRKDVLSSLPELSFATGQWREAVIKNDHIFDALICAYTGYLWARDGWQLPKDPVFADDGYIWTPPRRNNSI